MGNSPRLRSSWHDPPSGFSGHQPHGCNGYPTFSQLVFSGISLDLALTTYQCGIQRCCYELYKPDERAERHAMWRISCSDAVGSSSSAEYRIQEQEQLLLPQLDGPTSAEALREGRVSQEPWYLPICATSAVIFLSRILAGTLFRTKSLVTSGGALCAVVYTQEASVTRCLASSTWGDDHSLALWYTGDHAGARLRESPLGLLSWQLTGQHPHPN